MTDKPKIMDAVKGVEGLSCIDMQHFRALRKNASLKKMLEAIREDESYYRGVETDVEKAFHRLTSLLESEIDAKK